MKYELGRLACCILLLLVIPLPTLSIQLKGNENLETVPSEQRKLFSKRLNEYIVVLIKDQHKKILNYYDKDTRCFLCVEKSGCQSRCNPQPKITKSEKNESVQIRYNSINVISIEKLASQHGEIRYAVMNEVDLTLISKSNKVRKSKTLKNEITVVATFEDNNWYFSPPSFKGSVIML